MLGIRLRPGRTPILGDGPQAATRTLHDGSSGTYLPVKGLTMASVTFQAATRIYPGNPKPSVDKLDLVVQDGEFLVLVGPSGCGKSTSLRMLAGLEEVNEGKIFIGDRDVTNLAPKDRDIAMVFQSYALYPHMTVRQNMGFALQIAGMPKAEIEQRVQEAARILDLEPYLDRKPKAMSGGQRQRVAMGRAIVRKPQVFLMDEPLSNLDAKLRVQTRTQIAKLQRDLGVTTVYVTHDQTEAMTMGDRIAVLKDGLLMQVGTPQELYDRPNNTFVAGFIGSPAMNIVEVPIYDGAVSLGGKPVHIPGAALTELAQRGRKSVILGFRPEDLRVSDGEESWPVEVSIVEGLGADAYVYSDVKLTGGGTKQIVARTDGRTPPRRGQLMGIEIVPNHMHLFDPETGERLHYE
jgi:multiple sugar transport system ATP-binding protein